ncbi:MAG: Hsp20/alpha crystallin family protein [Desulfobacterota bacterium]|nr:Hsp20/alpha crystallin family protein [Thermodesulfobacteriota bacterium]
MVHYVKWEPFRDLVAMQERMARLFDETLSRVFKEEVPRAGGWSPPVDVIEREHEVFLKIDLPEMSQSDIDVKVEENMLIIQGERRLIKENPEERYVQIERPYGQFQRTFALPKAINQEEIKASYKDGVLRISLPKKKEVQPKQITIETT